MVAPRKYPDELRERAVRLVIDARKDPVTRPAAVRRIGEQLGINPETLRGWANQAEVDAGSRGGVTTGDTARLGELEREVRELRRANSILRSASGFLRGGARPPLPLIIDYVERYKDLFGVEPICTTLSSADVPIAPSTFYAARKRPPSARAVRDAELKPVIARVHEENYGVYGIRKMHAQLNREEVLAGCQAVARCTTQRLMKDLGLRGISRAKGPRTTVPGTAPDTREDLVGRAFTAEHPDRLWVADITYVRTFAGWVYCAFVLDVFSRRVVGWQTSNSLRTDLALDALNMGLWTRAHDGHDTTDLVHHSDRGVQYVAIRYTERLAEAGAVASVGSKGDSYDAMAEAFNSLFKAELVRNRGPWKSIDDLEVAVAEYIDWFNFRRLHGEIGLVPPVEYETQHRSTTLPEQPAQREFEASIKPGT
ncbi:MAG TPA: IS3 family transposase [Dermatophilaceae bacterium]|nr:IS3 family transposase [Dermatophilaceae bacterium]